MNAERSLLRDVTRSYAHARERYDQALSRGDTERADDALSQMQMIEDCIAIREVSREWRRPVAPRKATEAWR